MQNISRRTLLLTLAGAAGSFLVACSREDVHQAAAKLIPQETLREMGLQTWERFRGQFPPSRNADLQRRLQVIGARVVRAAQGNPEEWEFAVFRGDMVNAFAVPGGKVGFFEGMFTAARNDAQIGAVLGHEIGHLNAKHPEERIMAAFAKQVGIAVVLAALQAGDVNYANEIAGLLGVGLEYGIIRPYSRRQELEADRLGVDTWPGPATRPERRWPFGPTCWSSAAAAPSRRPSFPPILRMKSGSRPCERC
jgi:predicted Zn-dependent protease